MRRWPRRRLGGGGSWAHPTRWACCRAGCPWPTPRSALRSGPNAGPSMVRRATLARGRGARAPGRQVAPGQQVARVWSRPSPGGTGPGPRVPRGAGLRQRGRPRGRGRLWGRAAQGPGRRRSGASCCCSMARPGSGPPLFADTRLSHPLGFDSDIPSHRERFVLVFCTWNVQSPSTTKWSALDCPEHTIRISVPVPQGPLKQLAGSQHLPHGRHRLLPWGRSVEGCRRSGPQSDMTDRS